MRIRITEADGYLAGQDFRTNSQTGPARVEIGQTLAERCLRITTRTSDDPNGRTPFVEVPALRGDLHGLMVWAPSDFAKRPVAMWRHAFPVRAIGEPRGPTTPSGGGPVTGGGGGGPITPGGEVPGDSRGGPGGGGGGGPGGPITPGGGGTIQQPGVSIRPSEPTLIAGSRGTTETEMPPISSVGEGPRPDSTVLPIRYADWDTDDRFAARKFAGKPVASGGGNGADTDVTFPSALPDGMPSWAPGTVGAIVQTTDEGAQSEVLLHGDPRLIAANAGGPGRHGTTVCDLDDDGRISSTRSAPLQGAFRVVSSPTGRWGLAGAKGNALALQIGSTGRRDTVALWADCLTPTRAAIALPSVRSGGPIDCVQDGCKHNVGQDADGNPIVPVHFSASALFRHREERSAARTSGGVVLGQTGGGFFDGPIHFETNWPSPPDLSFPVLVHVGWDPAHRYRLPRDGGSGAFYSGAWKFWTTSLVGGGGGGGGTPEDGREPRDPPPPVEGPPPVTGGGGGPGTPTTPGGGPSRTDLGGGGGPGSVQVPERRNPFRLVFSGSSGIMGGREHASMVAELVGTSLVGRPQPIRDGATDLRYTTTATGDEIRGVEDTRPQVYRLEAAGKQVGPEWGYTQRPGSSRSRSGTADGMAVFMPPERDLSDALTDFTEPSNAPSSNTAFVLAPGTELAFALPDLTTGRPKTGVVLRRASTGKLEVYGVAADGTRELVVSVDGGGTLEIADGTNVSTGTTAGTQFATTTSQKLAFFGATPVVQQAAIADATDLPTAITAINSALATLRTFGLIAP